VLEEEPSLLTLEALGGDPEAQRYLEFNRFEGVTYFNREALELLLEALELLGKVRSEATGAAWKALLEPVARLAEEVGYEADAFFARLDRMARAAKPGLGRAAPKANPAKPVKGSPTAAKSKRAKTAVQADPAVTAPVSPEQSLAAQANLSAPTATPKTRSPKVQPESQLIPDDLTRIEGIGPKIAAALRAAGITTFAVLAKARETELRKALLAAGLRSAPRLETWAKQARYLAKGDEAGLERYVKKLAARRTR
jgi:predicted flap endonuclease-1-like 5' DNA nuclease